MSKKYRLMFSKEEPKRNWRKLFLVVVFSIYATLFVAYALRALLPVAVEATGEKQSVDVVVIRQDQIGVHFPESPYTMNFTMLLDRSFADFDQSDWWERLHEVVQQQHEEYAAYAGKHMGEDPHVFLPIRQVPTIDWLKENVNRKMGKPMILAILEFESGGMLRQVDSEAEYWAYLRLFSDEFLELAPMQLLLDGKTVHTAWPLYEGESDGRTTYVTKLENLQQLPTGQLLYMDASGQRQMINLPPELMKLTADDLLSADKTFTVEAEVLKEK